jgi:hypothetical protein
MAAVGGGMLHQLGVAQHLRERTQSHHRTVGTVRSAAGELRYAAAAGVLALQDGGHSALGGLRARIAELHQQATSGAEAAAATRQRAEAAAALLAAGHLDSAVAEYEQALQLSPNDNETVAGMRTAVREAFSIFVSPVLTEIYLCHARSCHEIEDGNAPGRMKP